MTQNISPRRQVAFKDMIHNEEDFCWNCRKRGHLFENCNLAKMRDFFVICGESGQFSNSWPNCGLYGTAIFLVGVPVYFHYLETKVYKNEFFKSVETNVYFKTGTVFFKRWQDYGF